MLLSGLLCGKNPLCFGAALAVMLAGKATGSVVFSNPSWSTGWSIENGAVSPAVIRRGPHPVGGVTSVDDFRLSSQSLVSGAAVRVRTVSTDPVTSVRWAIFGSSSDGSGQPGSVLAAGVASTWSESPSPGTSGSAGRFLDLRFEFGRTMSLDASTTYFFGTTATLSANAPNFWDSGLARSFGPQSSARLWQWSREVPGSPGFWEQVSPLTATDPDGTRFSADQLAFELTIPAPQVGCALSMVGLLGAARRKSRHLP